jgi:glycosyltransferase involved in cell wall biosynthesis
MGLIIRERRMPDISSDGGSRAVSRNREPVIALLPGGDRFEDFHDRIGVSMDDLKDGMTEGFPVAVVEAMACGLPVVATDISGVRDALGDEPTGLVVPREDVQALAAAIGRLLDDELLRRLLGERARQRAESEFSLQTVGSRLCAFMEQRGAFR